MLFAVIIINTRWNAGTLLLASRNVDNSGVARNLIGGVYVLIIAISKHVLMSTREQNGYWFGGGIYTDIPPSLRPWWTIMLKIVCISTFVAYP